MADERESVRVLSDDECWALLVEKDFGRLAVSIGDQPEIFPINYTTVEGGILVRTAEGTKLFGVTVNNRVAFEIDDFGATDGWSVVLKGRARALESEAEIAEAEQASLVPWIPTVKRNFIRIAVEEISGRRVTFGPEPEADLDAS
ncbi:MAG TPA: pyridoxamine 5'-phosphate oxidase family protein [Agromyces mariniharenae]|nr:pyridoxamine 5'-phosphate oxidase family protein [Agromyces mariniharenae]